MTKVEQLIYEDHAAPAPEEVSNITGMTLKRVEELASRTNAYI